MATHHITDVEVVIDFKTKEENTAFCENRVAFAIYQKYASGINEKEGGGIYEMPEVWSHNGGVPYKETR